MTCMFFADALDWQVLADRYGVLGVLFALFVVALFKRWIVMGYQLKEAEERVAEWKDMAIRGTLIAERVTKPVLTVEDRLAALESKPDE